MPANSRRKGHNFEREIARVLREIYPRARRGLQYQDGNNPPDIVGTPFHIECKRGKKPNVRAALKQAGDDSGGAKWVVTIIKDDHGRPFVAMPFQDWFELVKSWEEGE